jgi:hypothetical protein
MVLYVTRCLTGRMFNVCSISLIGVSILHFSIVLMSCFAIFVEN